MKEKGGKVSNCCWDLANHTKLYSSLQHQKDDWDLEHLEAKYDHTHWTADIWPQKCILGHSSFLHWLIHVCASLESNFLLVKKYHSFLQQDQKGRKNHVNLIFSFIKKFLSPLRRHKSAGILTPFSPVWAQHHRTASQHAAVKLQHVKIISFLLT